MNLTRTSLRLSHDAYDHLWTLLPLHITFAIYWLLSVLADKLQ